jgi:hypothetical protein
MQIKPWLPIKDHAITKFPNTPKSGSTNRVQNWVLFVCHPEFSYRNVIMANLNVEKTGYDFPNLFCHNALEEKVVNAFIFRTENTTHRFVHLSFLADYL